MKKRNIKKVLIEILGNKEAKLLTKNLKTKKEVISRMNETYLTLEQIQFLACLRQLKQFQV